MESDDPAELHTQVVQILDAIDAARRQLGDVRVAYADLDPYLLAVDELGPELAADDCLAAAQQALLGVGGALAAVSDAVYDAMRYTTRLRVAA